MIPVNQNQYPYTGPYNQNTGLGVYQNPITSQIVNSNPIPVPMSREEIERRIDFHVQQLSILCAQAQAERSAQIFAKLQTMNQIFATQNPNYASQLLGLAFEIGAETNPSQIPQGAPPDLFNFLQNIANVVGMNFGRGQNQNTPEEDVLLPSILRPIYLTPPETRNIVFTNITNNFNPVSPSSQRFIPRTTFLELIKKSEDFIRTGHYTPLQAAGAVPTGIPLGPHPHRTPFAPPKRSAN